MDLNKFIKKTPYLFHLTDKDNYKNILKDGAIYSTINIIEMCDNERYEDIKTKRRSDHVILKHNDIEYKIRDQKPLNAALNRCLDNCTKEEFINYLNSYVFTWPNKKRLVAHFKRYENENPIILVFPTSDTLSKNKNVKFSRLNSGATRANSYLGGKAPKRGLNTFKTASNFKRNISEVAEVVFENRLILPNSIKIINSPYELD